MVEKFKDRLQKRRSVMVRGEWHHLLHSKLLLVAVLAILFIPVLYSAIFLTGIWDPYGHLESMPVAVVNEDKGATMNGNSITIGTDLVSSLKKNKTVAWEFVTKSQADDGVASGHYYAVIDIPSDFSSKTASLTSSNPQQPVLKYTLTPAKNYVGSVINQQTAQKIENTIAEQISQSYVREIMKNVVALGDGLSQAGSGASQLQTGASQLSSGLAEYTNGVNTIASNQQTLTSGLAKLQTGASQLSGGLTQLSNGLPTSSQIAQLSSGATSIQQGIYSLSSQLAASASPDSTLSKQQATVQGEAVALANSLKKIDTTETEQILQTEIDAATASATDSTTITKSQLATIGSTLRDSKAVAAQAVTLLSDLNSLTQTLAEQQSTLTSGVAQLKSGVDTFTPKAVAAFQGYNTVRSGASQLQTGASQLSSGIASARSGSAQLASGANLLSANSSALVSGASQLSAGSATLASKLQTGAAEVKLMPTSSTQQKQIVTPVSTSESLKGNVPNYGYAMAPYMMSVSLFVGGLALSVMYPMRKTFSRQENAWRWWMAKMSVIGLVAALQATILMLIMVFAVGLTPDHPWQFIGTTYLTSFTLVSIITLLVIVLDNPGRLLAMILLVLQLAASEGIFPIQTAPKFYQIINPYLPMTHSIIALREAISSGITQTIYHQQITILLGFLVVSNLLLIAFFAKRGAHKFEHTSVDGDS